uniref:Lipase domain-containing protein n=1 Tax=Anopheles gambiae TaxID=7165 RepID=A0A8W7R185_ANOGA
MARLVWAFLLLVACTCSSTHANEPSAKSLHQPQQQQQQLLLSRRDAFELAQEREQVLAAQQSIASWRQTLHQHGRPAVDEPGTADPHDESELQRPEQRRRRRRKRADPKEGGLRNETLGPDAPTDPDDGGDDPDTSVVCYGPLGCFHETEHLPEMLPSSPAEVSTRFLVYTTTHRSEKPLIEFTYEELVVAGFGAAYWANGTNDTVSIPVATGTSSTLLQTFGDLSNRTVRVIVHGFGSNCGLVWIYEMRTALMAVENCTVICVDWENGAKLPNYVRAAANTRLVGRQLALLLRLLRTHNGLRLSRVHLIGFSLGSHVAGFAGAEFSTPSEQEEQMEKEEEEKEEKEEEHDGEEEADADELQRTARAGNPSAHPGTERPASRAGLWRITGLDPAGPLFEAQPPEVRLDAGDARYVDVIHSNGENLILGGLGSWQPMGTVDYYPNGGRVQHGCTNLFVGAVTDIIWAPPTTVEGRSLCNHRRAYKFFIDSVAPRCHFPAFPCESYDQFAAGECFDCGNGTARSACGRMGYYATSRDVGGYGQLYLRTRDEEPYCANQFRLRLRNAPDELPLRTVGRFELTLEGGDTGNGIEDGQPSGGAAPPLLTFNETFHLDEAREDREFHAGQWLTTILVPHPALGHRPRALTITYRPYRGGWWQRSSVGKQLWRIGPILLTADDQRTYGSCATLTLQADVPVRIELQSILLHTLDEPDEDGIECRAAEELNHPAHTAHTVAGASGPAAAAPPPAPPKPPKSSIDELTVGSKHPAGHDHFSWTPVAISIPRHSPQPVHVNEKRSFSDALLPGQQEQQDSTAPGQQPLLPPTAQTVQLFPSRLVSFFERAERYARRTWDALFSGNGTDGANALLPKLAAPPDAAADEATVATSVPELLLMSPARHSEASGAPAPATGSSPAPGTSTPPPPPPTESPTTSTEIRIALPTFRPMGRTLAPDGAVGSGRQHYTRFIPLVYEEGRDAVAASTAGARKAAARSR